MSKFIKNELYKEFSSLSEIQKEAVVSLLFLIAGSDQDKTKGIQDEEFQFIGKYTMLLKLNKRPTLLQEGGFPAVLAQLDLIPNRCKNALIVLTYDLMEIDSMVNEDEKRDMFVFFDMIGITDKEITQTLFDNGRIKTNKNIFL